MLLCGGEGAADLLFIDDGRNGGAEKDDTVNIADMDTLVEHVDAEEELQVIGVIGFE